MCYGRATFPGLLPFLSSTSTISAQRRSPYRAIESRGAGLGEPISLGGMAEEPLIIQVLKPSPAVGFESLFQPRIDMGFLARVSGKSPA